VSGMGFGESFFCGEEEEEEEFVLVVVVENGSCFRCRICRCRDEPLLFWSVSRTGTSSGL